MASTFGNRSDFITNTRQSASKILDGINELRALKEGWDAGMGTWIIDASGNDPDAPDYDPHDFAGSNEGLIKQDIDDVVNTTLSALDSLMATGHETNLERIKL